MANIEKEILVMAIAVLTNCALPTNVNASTPSYLKIYPDVSEPSTEPLYFALMMSFGGDFDSSSGVCGVQVALDQINANSSLLSGYTLHYVLTDSQCNRTQALDSFFKQVNSDPVKVALLGSGCSVATEPTAEVSHYFNMLQVSCMSSSAELSDRQKFKKYFQLLVNDDIHALGFFAIVQKYGWRQVAILQQDENLFTVTTERLTKLLDRGNISYSVKTFKTDDKIVGLGANPFAGDHRVYILLMYQQHAQALLCKAAIYNVRYPQYHLMILGWYSEQWWIDPSTDYDLHDCTVEDREEVLLYTFGVWEFDLITEFNKTTDTGLMGSEYLELFPLYVNGSDLNISTVNEIYAQACYDAMWTMAFALDSTITDLRSNVSLNTEAARSSGLADGQTFSIENFTYSNVVVAETMFKHFQETNFRGITGEISFNDMGIRAKKRLQIYKYRVREGDLLSEEVGRIDGEDDNPVLIFLEGETEDTLWRGGLVPYDGVPLEESVAVALPVTVIYTLLASAGFIFTAFCLIFNFAFRKRQLIRLTSPNMNYLIGLGAFTLYADVVLLVVRTESQDTTSVLCNTTPWLTSLGYSLCFGTMLAKMVRVYYIFNNPTPRKAANSIKDWHLALVVLALVVVDLVILVMYTVVEGVRGNLGATRTVNRENPVDTKGDLSIVYDYYFYVCASTSRDVTLSILFGYKGVLQIASLLFAFRIRKVKVKGLNDAKYITGAVYVTSIILAVILVSTYSLVEYVNMYPIVIGLGLLVGATTILVLNFVPKIVQLYRDPHGETNFIGEHSRSSSLSSLGDQQLKTTCQCSSGECSKDTVVRLRKRVVELENSILQKPGSKICTQCSSTVGQSDGMKIQRKPSVNFKDLGVLGKSCPINPGPASY